MSIQNIKELFCKRVSEANNLNNEDQVKTNSRGATAEEDTEDETIFSSLSEPDAGITEFVTQCPGFSAVIKQRFSDFQVHEIDCDGNIIHLTNFDIPEVIPKEVNIDILEQNVRNALESLLNKERESVEIDVTDFDKEKRRDTHKAIKGKYGTALVSNTLEKDDKKFIVVSSSNKNNRERGWPDDVGKFLHFVLYKEHTDTMMAINIIAGKLRTKASNFTYAGTKDKRGITSQWVSMWHLDAKRLNSLNKGLRNIRVGNFIYKDEPLKLGDLKGNHFEVALRNITVSDEVVENALNDLKQKGFLNYFGLQRFGSSISVPTYEIGKALLKGDFKTAVELILKPRNEKVTPDLKEARKIWWETRDAGKAFLVLKAKKRTVEGKLLSGLSKHGKNAYVNALDSIPRNVRLLYLHAYQSWIWNKVASRRIKTFGLSVLEGDLVLLSGTNNQEDSDQNDETLLENERVLVRCISKEEIHQFTIYNVVHPLPGYSVTYPNNVIHQWYEELLQEDDLSSEKLKQSVKQYSLSGTYRSIVQNVKDLSWKVVCYSNPEEDLILSDFEKLKEGKEAPVNSNMEVSKDEKCGDGNKFKALLLNFTLDPSTYATMAFREILRVDTSSSHQASLNAYGCKRDLDDSESAQSVVKKNKIC